MFVSNLIAVHVFFFYYYCDCCIIVFKILNLKGESSEKLCVSQGSSFTQNEWYFALNICNMWMIWSLLSFYICFFHPF